MSSDLASRFNRQQFANGYELVNGVEMHAANTESFLIPPDVIKRHLKPGQFIELRIDSPRFSVHDDSLEKCECPSCHGEMTKPILRHAHPATLVPLPNQHVPSRGWGEDFWVQVSERQGELLAGTVDNALVETRLHDVSMSDEIYFHMDSILAVHASHRLEIASRMSMSELKELAQWIAKTRPSE